MTYKAVLFSSRKHATYPVLMSDNLANSWTYNYPLVEPLSLEEPKLEDLLKKAYVTFRPCCEWSFKNGLWFAEGLMDVDCKDGFHPKVPSGKDFYGFLEDLLPPFPVLIEPINKTASYYAVQFKEDKSNRQEIAEFLDLNEIKWKYVDGYFFYCNEDENHDGGAFWIYQTAWVVKKIEGDKITFFSVDPDDFLKNWKMRVL